MKHAGKQLETRIIPAKTSLLDTSETECRQRVLFWTDGRSLSNRKRSLLTTCFVAFCKYMHSLIPEKSGQREQKTVKIIRKPQAGFQV